MHTVGYDAYYYRQTGTIPYGGKVMQDGRDKAYPDYETKTVWWCQRRLEEKSDVKVEQRGP